MMRHATLLTGLVMLCASLCAQQTDSSSVQFSLKYLNNGMPLVVITDRTVPLATAVLAVGGGHATQNDTYDGAALLLQRMLVNPSARGQAAAQLQTLLSGLGAQLGSGLAAEYVRYHMVLPKEKLREGMAALYRGAQKSMLEPAELERQQRQLATEAQAEQQRSILHLQEEMSRVLWRTEARSKSTSMNYAALRTLNTTRLGSYYDQYMRPENMLLIVGGDVEERQCLAWADSLFGQWVRTSTTQPPSPHYAQLTRDSLFLYVNETAEVPVLQIAWQLPGVAEGHGTLYHAQLLSKIFTLRTARLQRQLVGRTLASNIFAQVQLARARSAVVLTVLPVAGQVLRCLDSLRSEVRAMQRPGYFTAADLQAAQLMLEAEQVYGREKNSAFCQSLGAWWALGSLEDAMRVSDSVRAVRLGSLQQFATTYLSSAPHALGLMCTSSYGSQQNLEEALIKRRNPKPTAASQPSHTNAANKVPAATATTQPPAKQPSVLHFDYSRMPWDSIPMPASTLYMPDPELSEYTLYYPEEGIALDGTNKLKLEFVAQWLYDNPGRILYIDGHTNAKGNAQSNQAIALQRATVVRDYMLRVIHIPPTRIRMRAYGARKPLYDAVNPKGDARNRRVEFNRK